MPQFSYTLSTQDRKESSSLTWVLDQPMSDSTPVLSNKFSSGLRKENIWHLKFGSETVFGTQGNFNQFQLDLFLDNSQAPKVTVRVEVFFSSYGSSEFVMIKDQYSVERGKKIELLALPCDTIKKYYIDYKNRVSVKVVCRITHCLNTDAHPQIQSHSTKEKQVCEHKMLKDLGLIMNSGDLSDVTLVVKGQKFHAHKVILASRSPVFMAMFKTEMKEKLSNMINIPDISPGVMTKLLDYIYTDEVDSIENSVGELIAAAEKYQMEGLKCICSKVIVQRLNEQNAIGSLILADRYNAQYLKEESLNFIVHHIKNLQKMKGLDVLTSSHATLLREILLKISDKHHD